MEEEKKGFVSILTEQRQFPPGKEFVDRAHISSREEYDRLWRKSLEAPETFWGEHGREMIDWFEPFGKVIEWSPPFARFFSGGRLNVSYNCIDRHVKSGKADKTNNASQSFLTFYFIQ